MAARCDRAQPQARHRRARQFPPGGWRQAGQDPPDRRPLGRSGDHRQDAGQDRRRQGTGRSRRLTN